MEKEEFNKLLYDLTHLKDEDGNDTPYFCFATDVLTEAGLNSDLTEEDIAISAAEQGYHIFKVFPGETMVGGLVIVADKNSAEPIKKMYDEFYGEAPEIISMKLNDDGNLIEVEDEPEAEPEEEVHEDFDESDTAFRDNYKYNYYEVYCEPGEGEIEYGPDNFSLCIRVKRGQEKPTEEEVEEFLGDDYLLVNDKRYHVKGVWESNHGDTFDVDSMDKIITYPEIILASNEGELSDETESQSLTDKIRRVLDHNGSQIRLFEFEPEEGDNEWYIEKFDDESIDFSHLVGYDVDKKERMDGKPVASFMITGGENGSGNWDDYLDDLRQVFNKLRDETGYYPLLYKIDTDIADDVWNGYVLLYDKAEYDLEDSVNKLSEALLEKKKKASVKARDPNAAAMWGRTRSQTFKQKKGKGSYSRHSKHKANEAFAPVEQEILDEFTNLLNQYRFEIDYIRKDEGGVHSDNTLPDAADVHLQVVSMDTYDANTTQETFHEILEPLLDAIDEFDEQHNRAHHITYSFGFGGYNERTQRDYTGKITGGIDIRAPWIDDADLPMETIRVGEAKEKNELKARAKKHKRTDKKGAMGWFVHPNVEQNIQHFNHVSNGSAPSTITAPAGLGEDIDTDEPKYVYEYDLANKYTRRVWDSVEDGVDENGMQRYKGKWTYFKQIPETAYEVRKDTFTQDRLLRKRKNRPIMKAVANFFKEHPGARICVISARYRSADFNNSYSGWANTYRALSEGLDESYDDYYVVSDGKNPRHSSVYSEDGRDTAIEDAKSRSGYWEVLHYVKGTPEKIWSSDMNEDVHPNELSFKKGDGVERFEAHPRDKYVYKPSGFGRYTRYNHPEFRCPSDSVVIYKDKLRKGAYVLCPEAEEACEKFFEEHPRNAYCVLRGFDTENNNIDIHGPHHNDWQSKWGYELYEKVEKHDTLNPKLWDEDNHLKSEVREKILEIVKEFTDGLEEDEIKFKVDDIVLVGSNCSYNYNDKSDLDIHIRMDTKSLDCPDNLYPLLYSAYRSLFNKRLDIDFYGIPVELYIETDDTKQMNDEPVNEARAQSAVKSNGIYSVLNDEWIKEPVAEDIPELDQEAFDREFSKWEDRYNDIMRGEEFALTDTIIEKVTEKIHYEYIGPVYRFGRKMADRVDLHTVAVSEKQAYNNFLFKAAEAIGFDRGVGAQVSIDPSMVFEYEPEVPDDAWKDEMRCERCGRLLTDNGECPVCDLNDESALEESSGNDDKLADIEDFIEDIYDLRKTSIAKDGEYGIGNLVFKEIRNLGYLDNLRELKNALKSRQLSLE